MSTDKYIERTAMLLRSSHEEDCDGHAVQPECVSCKHWKPGPKTDSQGNDWSNYMSCWHGAYRPSFWTGLRATLRWAENGTPGAPDWCPRRLKNSQCTCSKCPECIALATMRK